MKSNTNSTESYYKSKNVYSDTFSVFLQYLKIFIIGGVGYNIIELLWRGFTHITMTLAGGICFTAMYIVNRRFNDKSILMRGFICCIIITLCELIFGLIFNVALSMNIWDYSSMPFSLMGQICLPYSALWFFLSVVIQYILDKILKS